MKQRYMIAGSNALLEAEQVFNVLGLCGLSACDVAAWMGRSGGCKEQASVNHACLILCSGFRNPTAAVTRLFSTKPQLLDEL
jgi:hypothetical protein